MTLGALTIQHVSHGQSLYNSDFDKTKESEAAFPKPQNYKMFKAGFKIGVSPGLKDSFLS